MNLFYRGNHPTVPYCVPEYGCRDNAGDVRRRAAFR